MENENTKINDGKPQTFWSGKKNLILNKTIDDYKIIDYLNSNGDVTVFLGEKIGLGEKVIIKGYSFNQESGDGIERNINKSIEFSATNHELFVRYFGYKIITEGTAFSPGIYVFIEYLTPLLELLKTKKLLQKDVTELGILICDAFIKAKDFDFEIIEEKNIFWSKEFGFKIGDILLDKELNIKNKVKDQYLPPECFFGTVIKITEERKKLYGLGMILYKLLNNGQPPFIDANDKEITEDEIFVAEQKRRRGEAFKKPFLANEGLGNIILKILDKESSSDISIKSVKEDLKKLLETAPREQPFESEEIFEYQEGFHEPESINDIPEDPDGIEFEYKYENPEEPSTEEEVISGDKKDKVMILGILGVISLFFLVGFFFINYFSTSEIYSAIDSGAFNTAFVKINGKAESGQNVDGVIRDYIDSCINREEYRRIPLALELMSEKGLKNKNYLKNLIETLSREEQYEKIISIKNSLDQRGAVYSEIAEEVFSK